MKLMLPSYKCEKLLKRANPIKFEFILNLLGQLAVFQWLLGRESTYFLAVLWRRRPAAAVGQCHLIG
jgi:hypothetical protein